VIKSFVSEFDRPFLGATSTPGRKNKPVSPELSDV